ncbi:unnamed protein product [Cyprideis torosa]|uniref:Uncharacterized protein n=1 Tax=Cyprideis torosa TaxID=163714 RepID=A0A7R8ZPJ1_9CRUS|nr:unnamed protein product [Cyprideis torosa]CAG0900680.1 unnamed protein product [Cyprideis torosa]
MVSVQQRKAGGGGQHAPDFDALILVDECLSLITQTGDEVAELLRLTPSLLQQGDRDLGDGQEKVTAKVLVCRSKEGYEPFL